MKFRERMQQRNRRYKQRMRKGIALALLVGAAAISIGAKDEPEYGVLEYVVEPGDTLWDISERFREEYAQHTYILEFKEDIVKCNPGLREKQGQVNPGDVIRIRYKRE